MCFYIPKYTGFEEIGWIIWRMVMMIGSVVKLFTPLWSSWSMFYCLIMNIWIFIDVQRQLFFLTIKKFANKPFWLCSHTMFWKKKKSWSTANGRRKSVTLSICSSWSKDFFFFFFFSILFFFIYPQMKWQVFKHIRDKCFGNYEMKRPKSSKWKSFENQRSTSWHR